MWRSLSLTLVSTIALGGCYSDHFKDTEILVSTMPPGAACTLTRGNEQVAEIAQTPGIAVVSRSSGDIDIACRRAGYADARAVSHALGNAVDVTTITEGHAGYDYETPVNITLAPAPR